MSKLKILSAALAEIATVHDVLSAEKTEKINADNALSFSLILTHENTDWINDTNVIGLDGDYFDIARYRKGQASDGTLQASVECEHISYRLNGSAYDKEYFTETGTPAAILTAILAGTPFSVGTIAFKNQTTYSIQQAMSRRALLVRFAELLGGELLFQGFTVSILQQRGSATPKDLMAGRNIEVISKAVDKPTLDESGNPTVSYECGLIQPEALELGDAVTMAYATLGINVTLRIVSITTNPYDPSEVKFAVSNTVPTIEDAAYRIATETVSKDALYNGCRIGPEFGFEAVRNDKKARAYLNSSNLAFQTGDGAGNWTNKLYYDVDPGTGAATLVFNGTLSANLISALSALISPNLYAGKATIAEVTVDQLDTSDKVQKYLDGDKTPDNFQRLYDQYHDFITASVTGVYGASVTGSGQWTDAQTDIYYPNMTVDPATGELSATGGASLTAAAAFAAGKLYRVKSITEYYKLTGSNAGTVTYDVYTVGVAQATTVQAKNREGELLYWTDETHVAASATETAYPVYTYAYTESHKMRFGFREDPGGSGFMIPMLELGVGSGTNDNGKGFLYKGLSGLYLDYYRASDGELRRIILGDDGIVLTPYALEAVDFYSNGFSARYSGETTSFTWTKDGEGKITALTTEDNVEIPFTWHPGEM